MKFLQLTEQERIKAIEIVADKMQLEPVMVEKDLWVIDINF